MNEDKLNQMEIAILFLLKFHFRKIQSLDEIQNLTDSYFQEREDIYALYSEWKTRKLI